jgi:hypothetical protein
MSSAKEDKSSSKPKGNFHNKFKHSSKTSSSSFKTSNFNSYKGIHLLDFNGDLAKWKLELKSLVELELPLLKKMFNDVPMDIIEGDLFVNCNTMYMEPVTRNIRNLSDLDSALRNEWINIKNRFLDFVNKGPPPGHFGTFHTFQNIASIHSYKPFSKNNKTQNFQVLCAHKHFDSQLR